MEGGGRGKKKAESEITCCGIFGVLFAEVSFSCNFEGMGGLNVMDVRREKIPLLWSTVTYHPQIPEAAAQQDCTAPCQQKQRKDMST